MTFTKDSSLVKSYVVLILAEKMTIDEVPNLFNIKEMVIAVLTDDQAE